LEVGGGRLWKVVNEKRRLVIDGRRGSRTSLEPHITHGSRFTSPLV
jgi:hypothetical protein